MDSQPAWLNDGVIRGADCSAARLASWSVPRSCDPPWSAMKPTEERKTHSSLTPGKLRSSARSIPPVCHPGRSVAHGISSAPRHNGGPSSPSVVGTSPRYRGFPGRRSSPAVQVSPSARTWLSVLSASGRGRVGGELDDRVLWSPPRTPRLGETGGRLGGRQRWHPLVVRNSCSRWNGTRITGTFTRAIRTWHRGSRLTPRFGGARTRVSRNRDDTVGHKAISG